MTQTPAADIVERLRDGRSSGQMMGMRETAATEIEALRAREAELKRRIDAAEMALDEAAEARFLDRDDHVTKVVSYGDAVEILASIRGETD